MTGTVAVPIEVTGHPASVLPLAPIIVYFVRAAWMSSAGSGLTSSYHQATMVPSGATAKSAVLGSSAGQPALGCPSGPKAWIERTPLPASFTVPR